MSTSKGKQVYNMVSIAKEKAGKSKHRLLSSCQVY